MRTKYAFLVVLSLIASLFVSGCATRTHQVKLWEYKVIQGSAHQEEFQSKLNAAAAEGYAVDSSILLSQEPGVLQQIVLILKRPKL